MPKALFPRLFASSTMPLSHLFEPTPGLLFLTLYAHTSNRRRNSDLMCDLGIAMSPDPPHESNHCTLETTSSFFCLYEHTAQPQYGDLETTQTQPPQHCLRFPLPKKQHRRHKDSTPNLHATACCGGTRYRNNPDQYS